MPFFKLLFIIGNKLIYICIKLFKKIVLILFYFWFVVIAFILLIDICHRTILNPKVFPGFGFCIALFTVIENH